MSSPTRRARWLMPLVAVLAATALERPSRSTPAPDVEPQRRYIVHFQRPPLVTYPGDVAGLPAPDRDLRGRLQCDGPGARRYLRLLDHEHTVFETELAARFPDARVHWRYRVLFNGMTIKAPLGAHRILRQLPHVKGVRTTDRQRFRPHMDASLPIIGAPTYWGAVGGPNFAGRDVKVAVVDTGIDPDNPFFDDPALHMPNGYPRGAGAYTSPKVIAARAYFRPDDPVDTERDEPNPRDHLGHGSHVAGTIAGVYGTVFDLGGYQALVSGVAPKAHLMNYKVFYRAESGTEGAYEPELMAAFEDAVIDGADVINNSWGGGDVFGDADPSLEVYANAVEAGVVVVFAAGNEGPGDGSVGAPAQYHRFISVANAAVGRSFAEYLEVTGPAPVDAGLVDIPMTVGSISAEFEGDLGPLPIRSSHLVDGGANEDGCDPFTPGAFDGTVALLLRGDCLFTEKITHAADASALAVIVQNHNPGDNPFRMGGQDVTIPAIMIRWEDGNALRTWIEAHPDAEVAFRRGYVPYDSGGTDQIVYSSSRGPTAGGRLKPELAAPGSPILSAEAYRVGSTSTDPWDWKSGTSMATPHVAGAAALLVQRYPTWAHDEIKAALVGTATRAGITSWVESAAGRPWELGGGRLRVDRLLDVRLLAQPPVIDGLEARPGEVVTATLRLTGVANGITSVTLGWDPHEDLDGITLEPATHSTVDLDAAGTGEVIVTITVPADASLGDYTGWLDLADDQGGTTVVPYHVRVLPAERGRDLLIVDLAFAEDNETEDVIPVYTDAADAVGLTWDIAERGDLFRAPSMPALFHYGAVLVVTGNDRNNQYNTESKWTLDRLASYLLRGGRVIVAGQGPLRDAAHDRFVALLGGATLEHQPLWDEELEQLLPQSEYRVISREEPHLISADLTLDASAADEGLVGIGEVVPVRVDAAMDPWGYPVLQLTEGDFQAAGYVGLVYDPFPQWGQDRLAEAHQHRAVLLGFGLELIVDPTPGAGPDPTPGSRAELLFRAWEWVSDRVKLEVEVEQEGLVLRLRATAEADTGIDQYYFDFGDGSNVVDTGSTHYTYEYDRYGQYEVSVIARSETGAAALWRQVIDMQPAASLLDGGMSDADLSPDATTDATIIEGGRKGCNCRQDGDGGVGGLWLLLVLTMLLRRRRRP